MQTCMDLCLCQRVWTISLLAWATQIVNSLTSMVRMNSLEILTLLSGFVIFTSYDPTVGNDIVIDVVLLNIFTLCPVREFITSHVAAG